MKTEATETLSNSTELEPVGRRILAMDMERAAVRDQHLQRAFDAQQMADWVNWLAPWECIAHLTFEWSASLDSCRRCYEKFMRRRLPRATYFFAEEANPGRDGYHIHALWADLGGVWRKSLWWDWFQRYGRARIEPVKRYEDVSGYCAKYVTKENAWWNVKLQWHRVQTMHGRPFTLDGTV